MSLLRRDLGAARLAPWGAAACLLALLLVPLGLSAQSSPPRVRASGVEFTAQAAAPSAAGIPVLYVDSGTGSLHYKTAGGSDAALGGAGAAVTSVSGTSPIASTGGTTPTISLGTVPVAKGGTNSTTALNNNRVMVSSGGAIVEASALTNGQLLIGSTGAAPVAAAITGSTNLSVTNGAGSIAIAGTKTPTINTATADSGGTLSIIGQHADDGTAQVRLDSSVTVTGQNVHTEIRNNGVRALGFGISGAINELGFYNSGSAGAFEGSLLANASTLRVYNFAAFNPYSDNAILLGGSGARWLSVGSYSYLGKHQSAATSGAVSISPSSGEVYRLLATGNVTSISISDGVEAQLFTLILVQKADGVPTWPSVISNARLVGGTFTKSTGASKIDTITFRWDAGSSDWLEIHRALDLS